MFLRSGTKEQDPEPEPSVKDMDPHPNPKCHGSGTLLRSINLYSVGLFYYSRTLFLFYKHPNERKKIYIKYNKLTPSFTFHLVTKGGPGWIQC